MASTIQSTCFYVVFWSGEEHPLRCAPRIWGNGISLGYCRSQTVCTSFGLQGREPGGIRTVGDGLEIGCCRWWVLSTVAARSAGDLGMRELRVERVDDATLGARYDPLLLSELPSLDDIFYFAPA